MLAIFAPHLIRVKDALENLDFCTLERETRKDLVSGASLHGQPIASCFTPIDGVLVASFGRSRSGEEHIGLDADAKQRV